MIRILQPRIHFMLRYTVCLFCLLRPLWGWMDRKPAPAGPPVSTPQTAESTNVLGELLSIKRSETQVKSMSIEKHQP